MSLDTENEPKFVLFWEFCCVKIRLEEPNLDNYICHKFKIVDWDLEFWVENIADVFDLVGLRVFQNGFFPGKLNLKSSFLCLMLGREKLKKMEGGIQLRKTRFCYWSSVIWSSRCFFFGKLKFIGRYRLFHVWRKFRRSFATKWVFANRTKLPGNHNEYRKKHTKYPTMQKSFTE